MRELPDVFGGLPHGVLPFSYVSDKLLPVRSRSRLPENAESIICVLFPYLLDENSYKDINISKYAVSRDYHEICGELLESFALRLSESFPKNRFIPFIDSSPIPEVASAQLCGLGVTGKNGLLINEKYGSWVFIGEIITDMAFSASTPEHKSCAGCSRCIHSCPAGALGDGFDREKCISHITQKKGELTQAEKILIAENGSAWGCDICQRVCPHNVGVQPSPIDQFYRNALSHIEAGTEIAGRAYAWRSEAVIERNLRLLTDSPVTEGDT